MSKASFLSRLWKKGIFGKTACIFVCIGILLVFPIWLIVHLVRKHKEKKQIQTAEVKN